MTRATVLLAISLAAARGLGAQQAPFAAGEVLDYSGTYKLLVVPIAVDNAATLSVGLDTIDGRDAWKFSLITNVAVPLYRSHAELLSWTTRGDFVSRRFVHRVDESNFSRHDDYRILPDSGRYRNRRDSTSGVAPARPIDDLAFLYFLRLPTIPLVVGQTYRFDRYFRAEHNPLTVTVTGREPCTLPDATVVECLVVAPVLDDPPHGMFTASNDARIWLTDDSRRIPVRIRSGNLTLTLQQIGPAGAPQH